MRIHRLSALPHWAPSSLSPLLPQCLPPPRILPSMSLYLELAFLSSVFTRRRRQRGQGFFTGARLTQCTAGLHAAARDAEVAAADKAKAAKADPDRDRKVCKKPVPACAHSRSVQPAIFSLAVLRKNQRGRWAAARNASNVRVWLLFAFAFRATGTRIRHSRPRLKSSRRVSTAPAAVLEHLHDYLLCSDAASDGVWSVP